MAASLQMIERRQNLEARIGQRIHRHHTPPDVNSPMHGHCQPVLCAVDDQDIFRIRRKVLAGQMAGDNFALGEPPGMRLIAQMRVNIARHRQLPERLAQRIALLRQRRVVEIEIHDIGGHHLLIDPCPGAARGRARRCRGRFRR